jgi:surface protein
MQRGINMVDLMMWLVIAAMLLAAALQGIGYYKQSSYIYQMKNDALHAAELVTAKTAQEDGTFTTETVALGASESKKTSEVSITADAGVSDSDGYVLRTTHPEITDKDVLFVSAQRGSYDPGIHVVDKGTVIASDGTTSIDPSLNSGTGSGNTPTVAPSPVTDTSSIMTSIWDTSLEYDEYFYNGTHKTCTNITVPLTGTVNATINWGDGTPIQTVTSDTLPGEEYSLPTHDYSNSAPGKYTITIDGTFTGWVGYNWDNWSTGCVTEVTSWGDGTGTVNGEAGFYGASALTDVARIPATMTTTSCMFGVYQVPSTFIGTSLRNWDVSNITDMSNMFENATEFVGDLSNWDTSKVEYMSFMFYEAPAFNGDLSQWNTSNVESMSYMFSGASSFNSDLSQWNTSNVTGMIGVFMESPFNQNIGAWDTSSAQNMARMFEGASAFNSDLSKWNTSSVQNMGSMFERASSFNSEIGNWDTSQVTNMNRMFQDATAFNGDISRWETGNVTGMENMFQNTSFNQNIGAWKTSNVEWMSNMFAGNTSFNQDLGNWNVSNAQYLFNMFNGATSFNQDLTRWVTKAGAWSGGFSTNSGLTSNNLPTFR